MLDQLRERRRLLAVLVAFGTPSSTLAWSVMWQSAVPVALGLARAVSSGLALGAAVVLAVTAATLPLLWRTMRPEELRWE